ncbi:tyrosine-type recombinase/integrase [Clostridium guangxiense]|uniref:tyrosine-type recombinase/integrase n=1 Tax=Clostridium guangxiense TaxID=1662055 RepID=UPI001E3E2D1A|nr:tyrosine-type recombinase/integrase [Clostridium guangxiense]MCD2346147.1 tyrosine-type recombinase/integrase [Clostridium guangxiense]
MKYIFSSHFKEHIRGLVDQKHLLGYPYEESERILYNFDQFCIKNFDTEVNLTKEIGLAWAQINHSEKNNSFRNRLMPIRELARYMNRIGIEAYIIPVDLVKKGQRYIPHIYTKEELSSFFNVLDQIPYKRKFPLRHLVIPVIFRVIYCCGLRPSEARKLKVCNVNLKNGRLNILESKGHKDRVVILADDVLDLCKKYYKVKQLIFPQSEYFFPSSDGSMYTKGWMEKTFRICWVNTGIQRSRGNPPRVYDFRHTFATNRLYKWLNEGKDLTACLPYLSAYMGHAQLSDTAYYIHLVPEFFPQMAQMDINKFECLIPEVEQ